MRTSIYCILSAILFAFASCNGEGNDSVDITDTTDLDTGKIDTTLGADTTVLDSAGYVDEEAEIANEIEKIYGEQWEFCDCVVKNDSVNNAILEAEEDEEIDRIIARMDVIDQHCKEMLTTPNTTPDERAAHEKKVNKCLKAAKN
ncbi:MAG: hypothetical protein MI810_09670 [Flavobacteriales bacterium]|jgi:hypothetical protein|nr:hypothetical protein [Flavobacteriales bacterium]